MRLGDGASGNEEFFVKYVLQPLRGNEMPFGDVAYISATLEWPGSQCSRGSTWVR